MKTLIATLTLLLASTLATAQTPLTLKPEQSMAAVLKGLTGKTVTLHLKGDDALTGKLAVVGDHLVQLTALSGKEFYDAVVELDAVTAVELRVRSSAE